jgi:hypothetical protein
MLSTTIFGRGTPNSSTPSTPSNLSIVLSTDTVVFLFINSCVSNTILRADLRTFSTIL